MIVCGDLLQHSPVRGYPLYTHTFKTKKNKPVLQADKEGQRLWRTFTAVHWLTKQWRQDDSEGGKKLQEHLRLFNGTYADLEPAALRQKVTQLCEDLQGRALSERGLDITHPPFLENEMRVVVLRNALRHPLAVRILQHQARFKGERVMIWKAVDRYGDGTRLSEADQQAVLAAHAQDTERLDSTTVYYYNARCTFIDNELPQQGHSKNCFGRMQIVYLHDKEPQDDLSQPYRALKYLPKAVVIKPESGDPDFRVVLTPQTKKFTLNVPGKGGVRKLIVRRKTIPMGDAAVVTDWFVQVRTLQEWLGVACMAALLTGGRIVDVSYGRRVPALAASAGGST
jgi:hypothetical protein